ncbi:N-acetylmuramoyl-L-alanine amidase (plasmid) [Streptomyces sp. BI20]|uniref:N-acetylmuramoyl-L-alanine amidase n=1 Tax=Streptomyces sp. BI20 TaxID=3403460 RepID=UPI003C72FB00
MNSRTTHRTTGRARARVPAVTLGALVLAVPLLAAGPAHATGTGTGTDAGAASALASAGAVRQVGAADRAAIVDTALTDRAGRPGTALRAGALTLTGRPFTSVGLSWAKGAPEADALAVEVRVRRAGAWGPWRPVALEREEGLSEEARRDGAPALHTGAADGIGLRIASGDAPLPADLRLSLIDVSALTPTAPLTPARTLGARATGVRAAAPARTTAVPLPAVHPRADWGADETLADPGHKLQAGVKSLFVHHTVVGNNDYTPEQVPEIVNGMYVHHIRNLGYGDFPYHFVVDRFGGIWEGRRGSTVAAPGTAVPAVLGGHVQGFNTNSVGIAMLGNFEPNNAEGGADTGPDPRPTPAAVAALTDLAAYEAATYGLDPLGTTTLVSAGGGGTNPHPKGTVLSVPVLTDHREVNATACPGAGMHELLPVVRAAVAQRLAHPGPADPDTPRS